LGVRNHVNCDICDPSGIWARPRVVALRCAALRCAALRCVIREHMSYDDPVFSDILMCVSRFLTPTDRLRARVVCKVWCDELSRDAHWRRDVGELTKFLQCRVDAQDNPDGLRNHLRIGMPPPASQHFLAAYREMRRFVGTLRLVMERDGAPLCEGCLHAPMVGHVPQPQPRDSRLLPLSVRWWAHTREECDHLRSPGGHICLTAEGFIGAWEQPETSMDVLRVLCRVLEGMGQSCVDHTLYPTSAPSAFVRRVDAARAERRLLENGYHVDWRLSHESETHLWTGTPYAETWRFFPVATRDE
jgi:hypothetical protein